MRSIKQTKSFSLPSPANIDRLGAAARSGPDVGHSAQPSDSGRSHAKPQLEQPTNPSTQIALLTGGGDKPYALGIASALVAQGIHIDFIGSDQLDVPELRACPLIKFLNLRGDQSTNVNAVQKLARVLLYYLKLITYAATAKPKIFHILWNNKFELFDRTVLMAYYRLLGKRLVFTAHNVNAGKRDGNDSWLNRLTLKIQYRLLHHVFVHTEMMKRELLSDFGVPETKVTVIPFGINNTVPNTALTGSEARQRLGLKPEEKVLLFFGGITPYKGLEYAVRALAELVKTDPSYRLVIAGKPKKDSNYWNTIQQEIEDHGLKGHVLVRGEYIPDEETEIYFKAADVLLLPYTHIFQSGVLFLGYSFGLPVIAADVGSLKEEIVEGQTGFVFQPREVSQLANATRRYFDSSLYCDLVAHRREIRAFANQRYSWSRVVDELGRVYNALSTFG